MHTARQMVDTSRRWLMQWPRNATSLLVRVGNLNGGEACKLFQALRATAVKFGLELASQSTARRDAKEASDARTALCKRWVGVVEQFGPGYRTARRVEMPDWVAVAQLPSYKVRRILHNWSVEVPRALMPKRALNSFVSAAGARGSAAPAPPETSAEASAEAVPAPSASTGGPAGDDAEVSAQPKGASAASRSEATATPIRARSHDIGAMSMPWGAKPKQDALRGVITSFDLDDGRCSYAATHKCHSAAWHWSRCIVVDHPDVVVQWEGTVHIPLADLIRCERCAVGTHPACAID